jgi:hypothetical protein
MGAKDRKSLLENAASLLLVMYWYEIVGAQRPALVLVPLFSWFLVP